MKTIMVRYKTLEAHARANEELVRAVFAEVHASAPRGFRYTTYQLMDGVSFVHVATFDTPEDNILPRLPAFQAFQRGIASRCAEPPVVTELTALASYAPAP